jgi:hypothetical protein
LNIKLVTKVRKIEDFKLLYAILLQITELISFQTDDKTCTSGPSKISDMKFYSFLVLCLFAITTHAQILDKAGLKIAYNIQEEISYRMVQNSKRIQPGNSL